MALLRRFLSPAAAGENFVFRSVSRSHLGSVRSINEDRVVDRADLLLWAVADGMGGHRRGDVAAETLASCLAALEAPVSSSQVIGALQQANKRIVIDGGGRSGTTVVLLHVEGAVARVHWAGDSRAYLLRHGRVEQLTRDHSVVQQLVDAGALRPQEAENHPQAHVITHAIGISPEAPLETLTVRLAAGDRILLCSDGLSRSLAEEDLLDEVSPDQLADRLLARALDRDGSDNLSFVLIDVAARQAASE